ncbi:MULTISPECIES: sulfatase-like hydrolase/transferase [unclassified Lentimonas]|uniref:sulfatase-like hydrolase/transferase n=1 Tax=unclassified Lentimonas TaxID=2630993 RepID=UPI00132889D4|nr:MULTISPECIES: sulfatase-like hydrolase/transferase [unclassified Lentimonas]CAA6689527.1 Choline-sulfatase (EC [Lentimonas sp. CC10]CAA6691965.1 Choline-sulfatase (EC [Lentimonas sp. CC19]CAA7070555.1 Choline-sulfatase (EC [Lentimonas sp. CC11]
MKTNIVEKLLPLCAFVTLLPLVAVAAGCSNETTVEQPNILIIFPDDLGYETIGAYGGQDFETPNIDAMAAAGVRFSRAYTSPVCTPSRVSLHTGLYTFDHKQTDVLPVHLGTEESVDFSGTPTFAQLLQQSGYQTSVTGKWQLATLCHHPDHPYVAGFDSWCVWQIWDCEHSAKTTRYKNPWLNQDGLVLDGSTITEDRLLPNGQTMPAGTVLTDATKQFGSDVLHRYVKDRMAQAVEADEPFLIVHNMMLPHVPIVTTPDGGEASLVNMIAYMDRLVGELLDEVEALGIRDNTYVFFIGDNGTQSGQPRNTVAGQVHGGKWKLDDAGTHVPFIVWGPSGIPVAGVSDDLVDITDVFPTMCEIAGVEIPAELFIRGQSIAPQMHGQPSTQSRSFVHGGISGANALFDGQWRYVKKGDSETIIDARQLPQEITEDPLTDEAMAAKERLASLFDELLAGRR